MVVKKEKVTYTYQWFDDYINTENEGYGGVNSR